MPGIFGLAGDLRASSGGATLARMAALLKHEPWYQESRHVDAGEGIALGRMALGFVNPAAQVRVEIRRVADARPQELIELLKREPKAQSAWNALREGEQRELERDAE